MLGLDLALSQWAQSSRIDWHNILGCNLVSLLRLLSLCTCDTDWKLDLAFLSPEKWLKIEVFNEWESWVTCFGVINNAYLALDNKY